MSRRPLFPRSPLLAAIATLALFALLATKASADPAAATFQEFVARGIVKAKHQAVLSTDLITPIERIGFREGEAFEKDAMLVEFDCRRQHHELDSLAAVVREAKIGVDTNEYLARSGAGNRNDVAIAHARHQKSYADWQAMHQRLRGCRVLAPYAGVVVDLQINPHETPQPNRPLLTIASHRLLEVEFIVPSQILAHAIDGATLHFTVDEQRGAHPVQILRTAGAVDAVSQTAKVYATFVHQPKDVLPGMSGTARLAKVKGN